MSIDINQISYKICKLRISPTIIGLCLGVGLFAPAALAAEVPVAIWEPEAMDRLYVDVTDNVGYIVHENSDYIRFPVATGLQKEIYWLHKRYYAGTPIRSWTVSEKTTQTDRVMFGKTGRFFRLNVNGTDTNYGIHGFAYFQKWLKEDDRHRSYGCIVMSEEMLDIVEATYNKAGKTLSVTTMLSSEQFFAAIGTYGPSENSIFSVR